MQLTLADMQHTRDHFALNPWAPGERRLTFHLTLERAPAVGEAAGVLQQALSGEPALRPVPAEWLHLTMTEFAVHGEVSDETVDAIAEAVFPHWRRFSGELLAYDQVFVADESVMLTARDDAWLHELAALQRDAVDARLGVRTWNRLWPHTTIAYATGAVAAETLRTVLVAPAASLPPIIRAQPTLTLMALRRDGGIYRWRPLRSEGPTG